MLTMQQHVDALYTNIVVDNQPNEYYLRHASQIEWKTEQIPAITIVDKLVGLC